MPSQPIQPAHLIIGHVARRWALDHVVGGVPLEALIDASFEWREGWEYELRG
jgi:2,3-bisphosphoglycerate-dependent phosphoglycerate mutase